jgi:hypothetical protein
MAITNAQQYQQLVNKPANGKRPGYRGSSYGSPSRSSSQGPAGGASSGGNYGGNRNNSSSGNGGGSGRQDKDSQYTGGGYDSSKNVSGRTTTTSGKGGGSNYTTTTTAKDTPTTPIKKPKKTKDNFKKPNIIQNYFENSLFTKGLQALKNSRLAQLNSQKQRENYLNNLQITNPELYQETIDDLEKLGYYNPDPVEYYGPESKGAARDIEQFPDLYEDQAGSILNTVRDNFDDEGTAAVGTLYDDYLDSRNTPTGGGGDDQVIDPCKGPNPPAYCFVGDDTKEDTTVPRNLGGLAPRIAGSIFDFTGLADGGRAGAMDGGRMRQMEMMEDEDDPTGGIMDLESGRQMYFLGKLVKKATRAVKKVAKSPLGKAALMYGLGSLGAGALGKYQASTGSSFFGNLFKSGKGLGIKQFITGGKTLPPSMGFKSKGLLGFMKDNPYLSILGGSTALAGLSGKGEDEGEIDYGPGIDIDRLRYAPYRTLAPSIVGSNYQTGTEGRKDGGRMGYQEGGDAEPVAKKTMPLLDMDGQEMDLRKEGGFVPLGRMERADDVPARLSKNEFVFTADAVRNAGEGDIDKGAEVMYNMMKNLESGGEVSEESQGLEGAREMFKTSQRLEEVL